MNAAIVTVGDELLCGDTANSNATWLCHRLSERGVDLRRVTTVPDDVADIAQVVNEYRAEYDAVLVTGGLGPTHDDITMEAVAAAVGRPLEPHSEAREWLTTKGGYTDSELIEGTTTLPARARMLPNTVGVAPGVVVESIYVFPGVPQEMKAMFERIETEFNGERTYSESLEVDEPESNLIDRMTQLQDRFDVSVGSYPGGSVRIKVSSADSAEVESAIEWLRERVILVE